MSINFRVFHLILSLYLHLSRLLQVEHRTTEKLTEQIEKRVGSETNSLDELSVGSSSKGSDKLDGVDKKNLYSKPFPVDNQMIRPRPDLNVSFVWLS